MSDMLHDPLEGIEGRLGYRFSDRGLLVEALTHRTYVNEAGGRDNQRLEFFGDAVLDFLLSDMLLVRFPDSREGELTRIRAALVDEASLGKIASELDLGQALRLGRGEEKGGGRQKRSLLADAFEALLAALYLDGGLDPARRVVEALFAPLLSSRDLLSGRDAKTELQETARLFKGELPRYQLKQVTGPDHDKRFTVEVYLGEELMGEGVGRTKKEAEQDAARAAFLLLKGEG
ncbi:ribonuclease III [Citrifermentans bemidjiense Bem]|uniref:Ribonuclease 3 n=1 Tax=Citrifermentans bemidjiense (strain ATCC BAA-1014 / DSM 16622 / JCM 12645 / Bem) TaxID=404380 RepID=B5E9M8_CITBB|nr:ribonuclease III [Citrifermentans bemidjiense]ACH40202.1 ribonuclease III [Citrifermentans bemidjiense Bem]